VQAYGHEGRNLDMRRNCVRIVSLLALLSLEGVALAQSPTPRPAPPKHTLVDLFVYPPAVAWLVAGTIACYLFSVAIVALFGSRGYPPTVGRAACWMGVCAWMLFVTFYIIGSILSVGLPIYAVIILIALLVLGGVLLLATRPHESR
jgi:hypothetical protein